MVQQTNVVLLPKLKPGNIAVDYMYGKKVSDENVQMVLLRISNALKSRVKVIGGDRTGVPQGSNPNSLHLSGRAADFYVDDLELDEAFLRIRLSRNQVFDQDENYEVIHHGEFTATGGAHLHVGHFPVGAGVTFKTEGLTSTTKDVYTIVG